MASYDFFFNSYPNYFGYTGTSSDLNSFQSTYYNELGFLDFNYGFDYLLICKIAVTSFTIPGGTSQIWNFVVGGDNTPVVPSFSGLVNPTSSFLTIGISNLAGSGPFDHYFHYVLNEGVSPSTYMANYATEYFSTSAPESSRIKYYTFVTRFKNTLAGVLNITTSINGSNPSNSSSSGLNQMTTPFKIKRLYFIGLYYNTSHAGTQELNGRLLYFGIIDLKSTGANSVIIPGQSLGNGGASSGSIVASPSYYSSGGGSVALTSSRKHNRLSNRAILETVQNPGISTSLTGLTMYSDYRNLKPTINGYSTAPTDMEFTLIK